MTQKKVTRAQRIIGKMLQESGLEYHFKCGPRHRKLYIEGTMVFVFSHGSQANNDLDHVRSYIRRAQERKNANSGRPVSGT